MIFMLFITQVDKEYAKFRDKNLEIYEAYYATLFRDSVAVGDKAKTPSEFVDICTPNDVQVEDMIEGKGDSDENTQLDDVELVFAQSSCNRKRSKSFVPRRATKGKTTVTSSF